MERPHSATQFCVGGSLRPMHGLARDAGPVRPGWGSRAPSSSASTATAFFSWCAVQAAAARSLREPPSTHSPRGDFAQLCSCGLWAHPHPRCAAVKRDLPPPAVVRSGSRTHRRCPAPPRRAARTSWRHYSNGAPLLRAVRRGAEMGRGRDRRLTEILVRAQRRRARGVRGHGGHGVPLDGTGAVSPRPILGGEPPGPLLAVGHRGVAPPNAHVPPRPATSSAQVFYGIDCAIAAIFVGWNTVYGLAYGTAFLKVGFATRQRPRPRLVGATVPPR